MPNQDFAWKFVADCGFGNHAEGLRSGVGGFVDMEVEVPALALGKREQNVERFGKAWNHVSYSAKQL